MMSMSPEKPIAPPSHPTSCPTISVWVLLAAIIAAHAPFLVRHMGWMWSREHYQFFPLVVFGTAWLAYCRTSANVVLSPSHRLGGGLIGIGVLVLFGAIAIDSTWFATVSFLMCISGAILLCGGTTLLRSMMPAILLLALIVPPPLDLDRLILLQLQSSITTVSSAVLDLMGTVHVRHGNVIELDGERLLVEQACSGINSLLSLVAVTLFLCGACRRGVTRTACLVTITVFWVLISNIARVVAIAYLKSGAGIDLSTGWKHDAIGISTFLIAVGMVISSDRLIEFLCRSSKPGETPERALSELSSTRVFRVPLASAIVGSTVLFGALILQLMGESESHATVDARPVALVDASLPKTIGEWTKKQYESQHRPSRSYFGERSEVWAFERTGLRATVSIDYPFPGWHDLSWCYLGTGWQIDQQLVDPSEAVPGGFVVLTMSQPPSRHGLVMFCEFDRDGRPLVARPGGLRGSQHRHRAALARIGLDESIPADPVAPTYQFQVFVESYSSIGEFESSSIRDLFLKSQAIIRESFKAGR